MVDIENEAAILAALEIEGPEGYVAVKAARASEVLARVARRFKAVAESRQVPGLSAEVWRFQVEPRELVRLEALAVSCGVSVSALLRAAFASMVRSGDVEGAGLFPAGAGAVARSVRLPVADVAAALASPALVGVPRLVLTRQAVLEALGWSEARAAREVFGTPGAVAGRTRARPVAEVRKPAVVRVPKAVLPWLPLEPQSGSGRWGLRKRLGGSWPEAARHVALNPLGPTLREDVPEFDSVRFLLDPNEDAPPASWARGAFERRALGHLLRDAPADIRAAWLQ